MSMVADQVDIATDFATDPAHERIPQLPFLLALTLRMPPQDSGLEKLRPQ